MNSHAAEILPNSNPSALPLSLLRDPEYVIYSFEKDVVSKGSPAWSRAMSLTSETEAFRQAAVLFDTQKFTRVEVRRKLVNDETGAVDYKAVKILDIAPKRLKRLNWLLLSALGCAFTAGLIVLLGN